MNTRSSRSEHVQRGVLRIIEKSSINQVTKHAKETTPSSNSTLYKSPRHCRIESLSLHASLVRIFESPNSFHSIACCVQRKPSTFDGATCKVLDVSMPARCEFLASSTSEKWHAMQVSNACFWNVLVNAMRSPIPNHKLFSTIWLSTTLAPEEIARLFSLQNKPTEFPPPAPAATTLQRKEWRSQLRSAAPRSCIFFSKNRCSCFSFFFFDD